MSVLDDIRGNAEGAHHSLEEAETAVAHAKEEAKELEESAANHGWAGVASAMSAAQESLDEITGGIVAAKEAVTDALREFSEITEQMSSDEVARRLGEVGQAFEKANGAIQQSQGGMEAAKDSAQQADATSVYQLVEEAEGKLETATSSVNAAISAAETERAEAASWGN